MPSTANNTNRHTDDKLPDVLKHPLRCLDIQFTVCQPALSRSPPRELQFCGACVAEHLVYLFNYQTRYVATCLPITCLNTAVVQVDDPQGDYHRFVLNFSLKLCTDEVTLKFRSRTTGRRHLAHPELLCLVPSRTVVSCSLRPYKLKNSKLG